MPAKVVSSCGQGIKRPLQGIPLALLLYVAAFALSLLQQLGRWLLHLVAMAVRHTPLAEIPLTQWRNASRTNVALTTKR